MTWWCKDGDLVSSILLKNNLPKFLSYQYNTIYSNTLNQFNIQASYGSGEFTMVDSGGISNLKLNSSSKNLPLQQQKQSIEKSFPLCWWSVWCHDSWEHTSSEHWYQPGTNLTYDHRIRFLKKKNESNELQVFLLRCLYNRNGHTTLDFPSYLYILYLYILPYYVRCWFTQVASCTGRVIMLQTYSSRSQQEHVFNQIFTTNL